MSTTICFEKPGIRINEAEPAMIGPESVPSIFVIFTSIDWTLKALEKAREMARVLGANVTVIAVEAVPYPLPLDEPPVPFEFLVRSFAEKLNGFQGQTKIAAYLCRDQIEALKQILSPESPVVIGIGKTFWPTRGERLARKLRRTGCNVVVVNQE